MSDTSVTTEAPTIPAAPVPTPLPNDAAARSPTGEILEPSQIAKPPEAKPATPPDGTSQDQTSTSKDPKSDAPAVPEKYEFTAPEGYTIDPKTIEAATPIFKELGLDQASAQKLVDFHTAQMIEAAKGPASEYETVRTEWKAKVDSDPELKAAVSQGKTGLEAVKLDIGRAIGAIGDPALAADFKAAMDLTGVGDNPAFIKTMWKLAAFVTEGNHVQGRNPSVHGQTPPGAKPPSAARALYPNLP